MKNLLRKLYPEHDEVSVFLMSIAMLALVFLSDDIRTGVASLISKYYVGVIDFIDNGPASFEDIWRAFFLFLLVPAVVVGSFFAALCLPFTTRDIRGLCVVVLWAHVVIMGILNAAAFVRYQNLFNLLFLIYAMSWMVVLRARKPGRLISDRQSHYMEAVLYGLLCIVLLVIAIEALHVHWAIAYSLAVMNVTNIQRPVKKLYDRYRGNAERI